MSHHPPGFARGERPRKSVQSRHGRPDSAIFPRVPSFRRLARRLGLSLAINLWASTTSLPSIASCASCASRARAQDAAPVLHEYIPSVTVEEAQTSLALQKLGLAAGGPLSSLAEGADVRAGRAPAPNAEGFRPDRQTSLEGGLDYYEAFDPSIAPFKRVTAFDDVRLDSDGKTPVLGIRDTRLHAVPIEPAARQAHERHPRDRFIGEIDLDFQHSSLQPLPSVSPESRIYAVSSTPKVDLQILQDGADNFFVRTRGPAPSGKLHLRWETDAPRSYFGTELPAVPLRELPALPPLEASIERRARRFAAELGITPQSDLKAALEALTAHFRNFVESTQALENSGDLYLDLCRGEKGLCRHRAYGFVVTARGLGIAARFVQNEAHSWVEVALPDTGYMRIDLGGATHGLTAHDMAERQSYVPAQPDALPRPDAYRQSYAQAARKQPRAPAASRDDVLASVSGRWLSDEALRGPASQSVPPRHAGDDSAAAGGSTGRPRRPLRIVLENKRVSALRGGKLVLTGQLLDETDNGRGIAGLRVELWILRPAKHQRMLLAVQVTDQDGYFRADFGVPPDLSVGDYRLIARTQGDAAYLPATTE